ncbi:unnamed protein product, partial [Ectocarpus sp. 12 AP-2014]
GGTSEFGSNVSPAESSYLPLCDTRTKVLLHTHTHHNTNQPSKSAPVIQHLNTDIIMAPMKLTYFEFAALGEPLRLALAQSGVEWIDNRVPSEQWPTLKPTLPYQQMPVLEVDGAVIPQSLAILRLVGKMGNLYPTDPIQAAFADSATDAVSDIHGYMRGIIFEKDADKKAQLRKDLVETLLPTWLANLEKALKLAGGKYFAGDKLSIGDIAVVARLNWLTDGTFEGVPSTLLEEFPLLSSLVQRVMAEPRIAAYMEERPKK